MPKKKPMLIHSIDEYGIITGDPDEGPVSPLQKSLRKGLTGFELGLDLARQRREQDQYNALRESLLQRSPHLADAIDRLMPAETLHPSLQKIEDSLSHLPKKRPLMDILKENAEVLYQVDKRQRARANQAQTPATISQATRPPATNSLYQEASYEPDLFGGPISHAGYSTPPSGAGLSSNQEPMMDPLHQSAPHTPDVFSDLDLFGDHGTDLLAGGETNDTLGDTGKPPHGMQSNAAGSMLRSGGALILQEELAHQLGATGKGPHVQIPGVGLFPLTGVDARRAVGGQSAIDLPGVDQGGVLKQSAPQHSETTVASQSNEDGTVLGGPIPRPGIDQILTGDAVEQLGGDGSRPHILVPGHGLYPLRANYGMDYTAWGSVVPVVGRPEKPDKRPTFVPSSAPIFSGEAAAKRGLDPSEFYTEDVDGNLYLIFGMRPVSQDGEDTSNPHSWDAMRNFWNEHMSDRDMMIQAGWNALDSVENGEFATLPEAFSYHMQMLEQARDTWQGENPYMDFGSRQASKVVDAAVSKARNAKK